MKRILKINLLLLCVLTLNILTSCSKKYTVTFKDYDGTLLKEENVKKGDDATAPTNPTREGYIFIGWSEEYTNIQKNTMCVAQYEKDENHVAKYSVKFIDYDDTVLKEELVEEGKNATAPTDPTREGYIFIGWDKDFSKVSDNLTVFAEYEKENVHEYTITFEPTLSNDSNPITIVYDSEYEDNYWENLEENGFISSKTLKEQYNDKLKKETAETQISNSLIPSASYVAPYEETDDAITKIQTARFEVELNYIYKLITSESSFIETDEFKSAYEAVKIKLTGVTRVNYLENLSKELILFNDIYELYFDILNTQFILNEKDENGNIINSWSSNPENSNKNNKAIFKIICKDGSNDEIETQIEYDSYINSCYENIDEVISPSFSVNIVKNSNGDNEKIVVYYTLEQKGIDATYIPNKISLPKMRELIERCNKLVSEYKAQNNNEYPIDSSGRTITELGFLNEILGINPATGKPFDKTTIALYTKLLDTCYKRIELDSNYNELPLEEQYYELKPSLSQAAIAECYRFFYEWCGYTIDDLFIDTGIKKEIPSTPIINIAIEYKLSENGLEIMIPSNSVKTNKNDEGDYYIVSLINLLPYFMDSEKK